MNKPDWWPDNPYPESIFPMKREEYPSVVPDRHKRTALSGMLGRVFWGIASNSIWVALQNHIKDMEYEATSSEEILAMIEGKGPPTQPEEGRMKYHVVNRRTQERMASFRYKSDRGFALKETPFNMTWFEPQDDE